MIAILCHSTDKPAGDAIARKVDGADDFRIFDETTAYEAAGAAVTVLVLSADAFADDAIRHTAKAAHEGGTLRVFPWRALVIDGHFGIHAVPEARRFVGPHLYPRVGRWIDPDGNLDACAEDMADAVRGEVVRARIDAEAERFSVEANRQPYAAAMKAAEQAIRFTFEGVSYTVPAAFYDVEACVLPDGRVLRAAGFLESLPPQPQGIHVVDEPAADLPRAEVQS